MLLIKASREKDITVEVVDARPPLTVGDNFVDKQWPPAPHVKTQGGAMLVLFHGLYLIVAPEVEHQFLTLEVDFPFFDW